MFEISSISAPSLTIAITAMFTGLSDPTTSHVSRQDDLILPPPETTAACKFDVSKIYGKIQFVDSFPDYKVKVVTSFPHLKVKKVNAFPDRPGKWRIVNSCPDYKIQLVDSFPDFTIRYVNAFPGVP